MNSMCVLERKEGSEINDDCKSGACSLWGPSLRFMGNQEANSGNTLQGFHLVVDSL